MGLAASTHCLRAEHLAVPERLPAFLSGHTFAVYIIFMWQVRHIWDQGSGPREFKQGSQLRKGQNCEWISTFYYLGTTSSTSSVIYYLCRWQWVCSLSSVSRCTVFHRGLFLSSSYLPRRLLEVERSEPYNSPLFLSWPAMMEFRTITTFIEEIL